MKNITYFSVMMFCASVFIGCGGGEVEQRPVSNERPSGFGADGESKTTNKKSTDAAAPSSSIQ